ncbi:MAG: DUF4377 domain-containing protein [Saprospiraceae bacterium]|nr:DUF4377 domain-containing protein [Saprospiraceae bacterium]
MNKLISLITLLFFLMSCNDDKEKETYKDIVFTVASKRGVKDNIEETPSYQYVYYVKTSETKEWQKFPYEILNFNYEEGYEYVIDVLEVTYSSAPEDAPLKEYRFISLINKEEKESENLPD